MDRKRKGAYTLFTKKFKVALVCTAIRTQSELVIRRVQFIRRTKEAATQAACAGNNMKYHSDMGTHGSITGKMMTRFYHITTDITPLLN